METLATYTEIRENREILDLWLKRFEFSALNNIHAKRSSIFKCAHDVLNQFGSVATENMVTIGDLPFRSERLIDDKQVYLLSPCEDGPVNKTLLKDLVAGSSSGFGYWQSMEDNGPLIAIYLPDTFTMNGENALPSGWVVDFGHFIFITSKALEGLAGRSHSHSVHEANHLKREIIYPEMHNLLYEKYPYLNEAVAILDQLHLAQGYKICSSISGEPGNLSHGLDLYYLNKLLVNEIMAPIDFESMNGDGKFVSELYKHRFALAIFLKIVTNAKNISQDTSLNVISELDFINSGMTGSIAQLVFDRSKTMSVMDSIDRQLDLRRKAGQILSDENFWELLLNGYPIEQGRSYKEFAESLWKKYLKYILPIYLTLMCSSSGNIKNFVESFDEKIKKILANDCPDFFKAALDDLCSRNDLVGMKSKIQFPR